MEYLPDSNSRYKDVGYWDERYRREESFEWFGDLSKFQHLLEQHVKKDDAILILGCGNSSLSFDMYQRGFRSITNVDYSSVCVETMASRHFDCPGMTWLKMDVRQLEFPEGTFDVVLEKATLDAMMVDERDPWHVSTETANLLHQVLKEASRLLRPAGRFISITFAQPHFRRRILARREYGWSVVQHSYGDGFQYFFYVMTKGEALSPEDQALEKRLLESEDPQAVVPREEPDSEDYLSRICL
ncbi:EEF1A lysine methyltransferase 4 isoform X1 [Paramormyrops kingsleyae]|uniref:EEF1A lysine methyltransferase 4 n=2 Tax=Paramormyrops kingsleyae TaxID=1676925 RepID=A0A3B3SZZ9_9TELE|nr:endothelin-converting enzyme 2-like isoform X1 [Paramormyrops kingsleyae]